MSTSHEAVPPDERPGRTEAPRATRDVGAGSTASSTTGSTTGSTAGSTTGSTAGSTTGTTSHLDRPTDRQTVVAREKEAFGGVKIGSAFFGWLAATGMAVLLTALIAGAGTAVGVATGTDPAQAAGQAQQNAATVGLV